MGTTRESEVLAAREEWLYQLADALMPHFKSVGKPIPFDRIRIGIGYTSSGRRKNSPSIGECLYPHGEFKNWEITIRIDRHGDDEVSAILLHELCHAALPVGTSHKKPFRDLMQRFGVITDTKGRDVCREYEEYSPEFLKWIRSVRRDADMGPYPHLGAPFSYEGGGGKGAVPEPPNMTVRFKCEGCGATGAQSVKWFNKAGGNPFVCNNEECGQTMKVVIQAK